MEVKDHLPLVELERLERRETNVQRAKRLRIVILALRGFTVPAVAMCVGLAAAWREDYQNMRPHSALGVPDSLGVGRRV